MLIINAKWQWQEWIFTPAHFPSPSSAQLPPYSCPAPSQILLNWEGWRLLLNLVNHESHAEKIRKKWTSSRTLQIKSFFIDPPTQLSAVQYITCPYVQYTCKREMAPPTCQICMNQSTRAYLNKTKHGTHTYTHPGPNVCNTHSVLWGCRAPLFLVQITSDRNFYLSTFRLLIMHIPRNSWGQCKVTKRKPWSGSMNRFGRIRNTVADTTYGTGTHTSQFCYR